MRERNSNLCGRKFLFRLFGHIFLRNRCYNNDFMLLFNRCIVVSLLWWFYPHLRQGNTSGRHWFVRRSFFPVWGRCTFLILLLSADLTAVPSQSTPGSSNIKIYDHIFLAHLNNGPGFYILSYREVLFNFLFLRGVPIRVLLTMYLSSC